jgi:hypothetical protein
MIESVLLSENNQNQKNQLIELRLMLLYSMVKEWKRMFVCNLTGILQS